MRTTWQRMTDRLARTHSCRTFLSRPLFSDDELEGQRRHEWPKPLVVSVVVPLYNTDEGFLREMLASVVAQTYARWELCLADGSDEAHDGVGRICRELAARDPRVRYQRLEDNLGISGNSNAALGMATGDYVALLDHDDLLHPSALYEVMEAVCAHEADVVYTDEAIFHERPEDASTVHLKPAFAPETLRAYNYVCHLTVFRRSLLEQVGGFDSSCDGAQDYDLILRLTEASACVVHIPEVLYYWRAYETSSADDVAAKPYAIEAGKRAVEHQLDRLGLRGEVSPALAGTPTYRVRYAIEGTPKVSVLIACPSNTGNLRRCLTSVFEKTTWPTFEVVIVSGPDHPAGLARTCDELVRAHGNVCVVTCEDSSYPAAINCGAAACTGDYLLLLDGNTEVATPDWIQELLMFAQRSDVGAAGAKLCLRDGSIWHAGVGVGLRASAGSYSSYFHGTPGAALGYMKRLALVQDLSAVTGSCVLVRREAWERMDGLGEAFASDVAFVDLCLRMREAGYAVVWTPYAELIYRGPQDGEPLHDSRLLQVTWRQAFDEGDPYFNPNCDPARSDYAIGGPQQRHPARVWRSVANGAQISTASHRAAAERQAPQIGADVPATVSVIIPTLNAEPLIGRLLDRLLTQTVEVEIIVVDSSSDDGTVQVVRSYGDRVRLLQIAREDFNHGGTRDYVLRQSHGDAVVFMTQDALPQDERCLELLLAPLTDPLVAAAFARQVAYPDASPQERLIRRFNYPPQGRVWDEGDLPQLGVKGYFFSNVCSVYRRSVYEAVGGFDSSVLCNEDMLMASKLLHAGYRLAYAADAVVLHSHDHTMREEFQRNWRIGFEMERHRDRLSGAHSNREGLRMVQTVGSGLLSEGRPLAGCALLVHAAVRLIGNRVGKALARREGRRLS